MYRLNIFLRSRFFVCFVLFCFFFFLFCLFVFIFCFVLLFCFVLFVVCLLVSMFVCLFVFPGAQKSSDLRSELPVVPFHPFLSSTKKNRTYHPVKGVSHRRREVG